MFCFSVIMRIAHLANTVTASTNVRDAEAIGAILRGRGPSFLGFLFLYERRERVAITLSSFLKRSAHLAGEFIHRSIITSYVVRANVTTQPILCTPSIDWSFGLRPMFLEKYANVMVRCRVSVQFTKLPSQNRH